MKNRILFFLATLFFVAAIYGQSINNPLHFDSMDRVPNLFGFNFRPGQQLIHQIAGFEYGRTFTLFTFKIFEAIGLNGQNAVNIFLHLINATLLFVFLGKVYSQRTASIVSLFFAVNPAAIYAVCHLIERSQLLIMSFGVLQCILYLYALRSRWWISSLFFLASLLSFRLAILSKENAIVFISIYPLITIANRETKIRSILYPVVFLILGLFLYERILKLEPFGFYTEHYQEVISHTCTALQDQATLYFRSILTQAGLFFRYFLSWLLPLPTSIDMRVAFVDDPQKVWGLVFFKIYVLAAFFLLIKNATRYLGCGFLMAALFFLPEFSRTRIGEVFVMYRSYIYSLGYMIALGWVVERFNPGRWAYFFIAGLALVTYSRVQTFDSNSRLWTHAAGMIDTSDPEIACQAPRAFGNAGAALLSEGRPKEAIPYLKKASELAPSWDPPFSNLGVAYYFSGKFDQAEIIFSALSTRGNAEMSDQANTLLKSIRAIWATKKESR